MTIADLRGRGKALAARIPADMLLILVLLLATTLAFGLGVLAGRDMGKAQGSNGFWIEELPREEVGKGGGPAAALSAVVSSEPAPVGKASGTYVASKNGTKYYLPSCGGSKRIKEENKIWFDTKEEAESAGYGPAANCPGL
ncbi:MAG TPA: hypothetical protein VNU25_01790 [Candidatus Paceibacterota bacterium]|nr:hypothetical protein [Candidatus Paceibacterota bacterium]